MRKKLYITAFDSGSKHGAAFAMTHVPWMNVESFLVFPYVSWLDKEDAKEAFRWELSERDNYFFLLCGRPEKFKSRLEGSTSWRKIFSPEIDIALSQYANLYSLRCHYVSDREVSAHQMFVSLQWCNAL